MTKQEQGLAQLSFCSPSEKILKAAKIIETAAYDLAGEVDTNKVTSLILISAQLEKIGKSADVRRLKTEVASD